MWLTLAALLLLVPAALLATASMTLGYNLSELRAALTARTPSELARYAQRRLQGHPRLEAVLGGTLRWVIHRAEREPAADALPSLGKGWQAQGVGAVRHDAAGRPLPVAAGPASLLPLAPPAAGPAAPTPRLLADEAAIERAFADAQPGDVLEVLPGTYRVTRTWTTRRAGTPSQPITLRAERPGSVRFDVTTVQAVVVRQPFWVFENLDWQGRCKDPGRCEHAFHVVGAARGTVIVNNRLADFNAHIKVNGERGQFPDEGLVQWTTFSNAGPRKVDAPVVPFDLVAASGWRFADNIVSYFAKPNGQGIAYGVFMKGGGENGRIERNLVVCTPGGVSQRGLRVGISVGGGGTGKSVCRDKRCDFEHRGGVVANNIVAHCNDFGIDIYRSVGTRVLYNTLVNTAGIEAREAPAGAELVGNLLDGRIRARKGAELWLDHNWVADLPGLLADPDRLRLAWSAAPELTPRPPDLDTDFCGQSRPAMQPPGATLAPDCGTDPNPR